MEGLRAMLFAILVDGLCIPGEPIEAILGQAARWEADVIAVDAQSRRGLSRWVLGSIACRRGDRRQVIS